MKPYYIRQCEMKRSVGFEAIVVKVAWIPEKFAKVGKYLKIRQKGEWVDGWLITAVYEHRMLNEELIVSCIYDKKKD